jgi:hypothetical protein
MIMATKVASTFYHVQIYVLMSNIYIINESWAIQVYPLLSAREPTTDDSNPQGTMKYLDLVPRENESKSIGRDPLEGGN